MPCSRRTRRRSPRRRRPRQGCRCTAREADEDLPLFGPVGILGEEDRRRIVREAVDREAQQQIVVMGLLQRRQAGQDDVGVPGCLVEEDVDRDHRFEAGQRLVEAVPTRGGQHGIARDRDQRLDLAFTRCGDLLGQAGHRRLAQDLLRTAHPGAPAPEAGCAVLQPGQRLGGQGPDRRAREHRAAGCVEVSGEDVHHVDQPAGEAAEFLIAQPDSAVDDGPRRGGELARQVSDPGRVDAAGGRDALGRPVVDNAAEPVEPVEEGLEVAGADQALVEQDVRHGEQQCGVGARVDREPFVGPRRGRGADRIDHDDLAALADLVDQADDVGGRHHRALRGGRVGAHDDEHVGALEVGDGEAPPAAVHQV